MGEGLGEPTKRAPADGACVPMHRSVSLRGRWRLTSIGHTSLRRCVGSIGSAPALSRMSHDDLALLGPPFADGGARSKQAHKQTNHSGGGATNKQRTDGGAVRNEPHHDVVADWRA